MQTPEIRIRQAKEAHSEVFQHLTFQIQTLREFFMEKTMNKN